MDGAVPLRFRFAAHVYTCDIAGNTILLDVRRDRYLGFGPDAVRFFSQHIRDLCASNDTPASSTLGTNAATDCEAADALESLIANGTIVPDDGAPLAPRDSIQRAETGLADEYIDTEAKVRWRDVAAFFFAAILTLVLLHTTSLERTLKLSRGDRTRTSDFDAEKARRLMQVFSRLRTLCYTAHNECLFNSVAARHFLSLYGIRPRIVIGVAVSPFKAHCWLQHERVVVNDRSQMVRGYYPILVV